MNQYTHSLIKSLLGRHFLIFIILLNLHSGCIHDSNHQMHLHGHIADTNISEIFISKSAFSLNAPLDTLKVRDGKFEYSTPVNTPDIQTLHIEGYRQIISFVAEQGDIQLQIKDDGHFDISGRLNSRFKSYYDEAIQLMKAASLPRVPPFEDQNLQSGHEQQLIDLTLRMFNENPSNAISAFAVLNGRLLLPDRDLMFDSLYQNMNNNVLEDTEIGRYLKEHQEKLTASKASPLHLPDVALKDLEGNMVNILDFRGQTIFIDFWAHWCIPCRKEIPKLAKLREDLKGKTNITFLSISTDLDLDNWKQAIEIDGPTWRQLIPTDRASKKKLARHWGILRLPHGVLIDSTGETLSNSIRSVEDLERQLDAFDLR